MDVTVTLTDLEVRFLEAEHAGARAVDGLDVGTRLIRSVRQTLIDPVVARQRRYQREEFIAAVESLPPDKFQQVIDFATRQLGSEEKR